MSKPVSDYKSAGVDIDATDQWLKEVKDLAQSTNQPGVMSGIGGFASLVEIPAGYRQAVLVSSTDGVGTKLKLAIECQQHQGIGVDLVAMCVNDVITTGAKPLYFLDYLATGNFQADVATQLLQGITQACQYCDMALVGGETAEMPGCYAKDHYDLAGFCVGIVEKEDIIDGRQVQEGDQLLALASSGPHANGFSLIRKILSDQGINVQKESLDDRPLAEHLLCPTRLYVPQIAHLQSICKIHAMAHITGGGIIDNLPRVLPSHCAAQIQSKQWPTQVFFDWLQKAAGLDDTAMHRTFNMGVGMVLVLPADDAQRALQWLQNQDEPACIIGEIVARHGDDAVVWCA